MGGICFACVILVESKFASLWEFVYGVDDLPTFSFAAAVAWVRVFCVCAWMLLGCCRIGFVVGCCGLVIVRFVVLLADFWVFRFGRMWMVVDEFGFGSVVGAW